MKIILSRKGFDSANGGHPSPILSDGKLVSLPIPQACDSISYGEVQLNQNKTYYDLMRELNIKEIRYENSKRQILQKDTKCHLDPDIYRNAIKRQPGWKPLFGQTGAALTHLKHREVKEEDVFLFFGWFKSYCDRSDKGKHVIFGYFQIGEVFEQVFPEWMNYHPHASKSMRDDNKNRQNTIYVYQKKLTWNDDLPGAGVFPFNEALILTKKGHSRSQWRLDECFKGIEISYHNENSWKDEGYFQSAGRGQEFVINDPSVEQSAINLINQNALPTQ